MAVGPTIVAKFLADTSKMTDEVDKATSSAGSKIGGFAKNAALALGGAFAVSSIVDFGKASVEAAAADAEAADKLAQTMRNVAGASDEVIASNEDFIGSLSKSAAIADDDLRPAMDKLVRGFGNTEDAQKALSLATDVSAGSGKDLATVTDAMMKAANGSTGALSKMGVEVKKADGSAKSLDEIMADMSTTFSGQASTAAKSTAGQMRNAQIQFGEFQEQIGTALLPVLASLAGFLMDTLIPAISDVAKFMGDNKEAMIAGFIALAIVVGSIVIPAFITWATAAGAAALATLAAVAPFILIGAAIAVVAFLIMKNWDTIKAATAVVWEFIGGAVTAVWEGIKAGVTLVWGWIQTVFGWIVSGIELYVGTVIAFWTGAWNVIKAVVTTLWDWIQTVFGWIVTGITTYVNVWTSIITGAWNLVKSGVTAVYQWTVDKFNAIAQGIQSAMNTAVGFVTGAWDSIKSGASAVWSFVTGKWDAIADHFRSIVARIADTANAIVSAIKPPINALISRWNGLAFAIPTIAIPEVDLGPLGKHGGGTLGGFRIDFPNLPYLAKGGVLTGPTVFVGGEAGTEIVAPEDMLRSIVADESRGGHYTLNLYPRTADASDIAYGFRRLELLAGLP